MRGNKGGFKDTKTVPVGEGKTDRLGEGKTLIGTLRSVAKGHLIGTLRSVAKGHVIKMVALFGEIECVL